MSFGFGFFCGVLLAGLVFAREWTYWGRGRWVGVPPPKNVIPFRRKQ